MNIRSYVILIESILYVKKNYQNKLDVKQPIRITYTHGLILYFYIIVFTISIHKD